MKTTTPMIQRSLTTPLYSIFCCCFNLIGAENVILCVKLPIGNPYNCCISDSNKNVNVSHCLPQCVWPLHPTRNRHAGPTCYELQHNIRAPVHFSNCRSQSQDKMPSMPFLKSIFSFNNVLSVSTLV